jgi:predicted acyltransferase
MGLMAVPVPARTDVPAPRPAPAAERLVSLDAFRGLTIASMILVNNPGSWLTLYWPLGHAPWHGWTPTDLIFPFFLFMVGMSLNFSRRVTAGQALRRTAALVGLGLFMAAYPFFDLGTVRIPGVLQRIALCYLATWALRRVLGNTGLAVAAAALLAGYWLLMTRVPVPGGLAANLEPQTNLGAYVDRLLLDGHLWSVSKTWDPEGLLSTLPAIATTVLGALAGAWLRSPRTPTAKAVGLWAGGAALTVLGLAWGTAFPINKSLWTSSFVLLTAGLGAYLFGLCYWLVDVRGHREWTRPFVVYGRNAILVYVGAGLLAKTLNVIKLPDATGEPVSLQARIFEVSFASWLPPYDASLAYAVATVLLWYVVLRALDRRGLYFKV